MRAAGRLTQWPECYLHTVEVRGSNPLSPTIFLSTTCAIARPGKTACAPKSVPLLGPESANRSGAGYR